MPDGSVEALASCLRAAADRTWDSAAIRRHAERFSRDTFSRGIGRAADELMTAPAGQPW